MSEIVFPSTKAGNEVDRAVTAALSTIPGQITQINTRVTALEEDVDDLSALPQQVATIGLNLDGLENYVKGVTANYTNGYLLQGEEKSSTSYVISEYIPVSAGDTITWCPNVNNGTFSIHICMYDSEKNYITGQYWSNSQSPRTITPTNSSIAYCRGSFLKSAGSANYIKVNGATEWQYVEEVVGIDDKIVALNTQMASTQDGISENTEDIAEIRDKVEGSENNYTDGYLVQGVENASSSYVISDYVPVTNGDSIKWCPNVTNQIKSIHLCLYDSNKNYISGQYWSNLETPRTITLATATPVSYCRASFLKSAGTSNYIQVNGVEKWRYADATTGIVGDIEEMQTEIQKIKERGDGLQLVEETGFFFIDEDGNVVLKIGSNGLDAAEVASHLVGVIKSKMDFRISPSFYSSLIGAHRGLLNNYPENTMPSFIAARDAGYKWIETDIVQSSDGVQFCLHDTTIDRTSDGTGAVSSLTSEELLTYDFGSWKGSAFTGTKIPTLKEFLNFCRRNGIIAELDIDDTIRYLDTMIQTTLDVVKECGMLDRTVFIGSYARLQKVYDIEPTAILMPTGTYSELSLLSYFRLSRLIIVPVAYANLSLSLSESIHSLGAKVRVWMHGNYDTATDAEVALSAGADYLLTDTIPANFV